MAGQGNQFRHLVRRAVRVEDRRKARLAREAEEMRGAFLPSRVAQDGVDPLRQAIRKPVGRARKGPVGIGDDHALARPVDDDGRERRSSSRRPPHARAIDLLALQSGDDLPPDRILAQGGVERHRAPEPGDRHGPVRRRAAPSNDELVRAEFFRPRRHRLDAKHLVERRDADAEHTFH
jgi:hypothetical protein